MKKEIEKKNYLLLERPPKPERIFKEYLENSTGWKWEIKHAKSGFSDPKWKRVMKFFVFPVQFFFKRKEISSMISYQQFYGLIYAWYCSLFRVKKNHKLIITTFIYRPKTGVVGKVSSSLVNKIYYPLIVKDKKFYAAATCNGCGLCEKKCPLGNITMTDGKPQWHGDCTH